MKTTTHDDYIACQEYQKHISEVSKNYPDFITFEHKSNFFFAWVREGKIILRSEAYPSEDKMERGIKAVIKNWDLPERYSVEEKNGVHHLLLWGGGDHQKHTGNFESHNEIGRSCPMSNRESVNALLWGKGRAFADQVVPLSAKTAMPVPPPLVDRLLSEEKTEIHNAIPAALAPEVKGSGFNVKWLLLPLLLLPLFFLKKSCGERSDVVTPPVVPMSEPVAEKTVVETAPVEPTAIPTLEQTPQAAQTVAATTICDLNWILFDFDRAIIKKEAQTELKSLSKVLKSNPTYRAVLSAHTDAKGSSEYNQALSLRRAKAAREQLIKLGITKSKIETKADSEDSPYATNTDDDTGRQFNRRVEISVLDSEGKEVCRSNPPQVPQSVKNQ